MYARLEPITDPNWNWQVVDDAGTVLVRLSGDGSAVAGPAIASLVADHGYPNGHWAADGDGFLYTAA